MHSLSRALVAAALLTLPVGRLTAQSASGVTPAAVATNPDVLAAERLFSAWLDGQMAYKGLPGVAVGVVHDQQLVWSKGFGFADLKIDGVANAQGDIAFDDEPCATVSNYPGTISLQSRRSS